MIPRRRTMLVDHYGTIPMEHRLVDAGSDHYIVIDTDKLTRENATHHEETIVFLEYSEQKEMNFVATTSS